jgi:hypothetical protein
LAQWVSACSRTYFFVGFTCYNSSAVFIIYSTLLARLSCLAPTRMLTTNLLSRTIQRRCSWRSGVNKGRWVYSLTLSTTSRRPNSMSFSRSFSAQLTLSYLLESVSKYSNQLSLSSLAGTRITLLFNVQLNSKLRTNPTQSTTSTALLLSIAAQYNITTSGLTLQVG